MTDDDDDVETNIVEILLTHIYVYEAGQHRCECGERLHKMSQAQAGDWFVAHLAEQISNTVKDVRKQDAKDQEKRTFERVSKYPIYAYYRDNEIRFIGFGEKAYAAHKSEIDKIVRSTIRSDPEDDDDRSNRIIWGNNNPFGIEVIDTYQHSAIPDLFPPRTKRTYKRNRQD